MSKDIESCRVALENTMRGLPLVDQMLPVKGWLNGAFDWRGTKEGHHFRAAVATVLNTNAALQRLNGN